MKKLLIIVSSLFSQVLLAQDTLQYKPGPYKVSVTTSINDKAIDGYLNSFTDTSVNISSKPVLFHGYGSNNTTSTVIDYRDISFVDIKRPNRALTGLLFGAGTGALVGVLAGVASGDDNANGHGGCFICFSAGEKASTFGVLLGLTGAIVGAGIGSLLQKTFVIRNSKEKFDEMRWQLVH